MNIQDIGKFAADFLDDLDEQGDEEEYVQLTIIARGGSGMVYQRTSGSDTEANLLLLARAMKIEQEIDE